MPTANILIADIFKRMNHMKVVKFETRIIIKHGMDDWNFVESVARHFNMVSERWMENQEPRTTIYLT